MGRSVFSQSWHNAAPLRPRLLPHTRLYPHTYRGQRWFVVQDTTGARYHRLSLAAYQLVSRMDGQRTVQQLWDEASRDGGDDLPTQDDVVELLMQLHANDLLECDVTPDAAELFERYTKRRTQKWKQWLLNPMSLKLPLLNPERFLDFWAARCAWMFGARGAALWLAVVLPALVLAGQHWNELTGNLSDRVLATHNLLVLALVYPVVKALHELGHGFATKVWGGPVHEMGLMFMVFAPAPYVDASSASTFRSKRKRMVVGAAGMLVELFLAALAMYVWVLVEPGVTRAVAFNVMLVAGVSTLIVNGNPLLRYDAYFILCDWLEMPNLGQRGARYLVYLSDRYLFGARDIEASTETRSEKAWLFFYTIASWCYKVFVALTIALFVANEFFFFGVLLALYGVGTLVLVPLWKAGKHLLYSPTLHRQRGRAIKTTLAALAASALLVGLVPAPLRTQAEGVVWLPDQALVRSAGAGVFKRWLARPGSAVQPGTPLFELEDRQLAAEWQVAEARVTQARAQYLEQQFANPVAAQVIAQQLAYEQRASERLARRMARLVVRSGAAGVLTVASPDDLVGQYFKEGELLAYVLDRQRLIARVAVVQENIGLLRSSLQKAELRFVDAIPRVYPVQLLRQTPGGQQALPTAALGTAGGGLIAVDPNDKDGLTTLERVFYVDLSLPPEALPSAFGGRVLVRFEHASEPLAVQWWRRLRQLFLSQFHV